MGALWLAVGVLSAFGLPILTANEARSAPSPADWSLFTSGEPVAQVHLDESVSVVAAPGGATCVLSRMIDIDESRYLAPGDRAPVPFDEVIRSRAASYQLVTSRAGEAAIRIQLKYALDSREPASLASGHAAKDLRTYLEPSGDSLWLDAETAAPYRAALVRGESLELSAVSRNTGRRVQDKLRLGETAQQAGARAAALEDCVAAHGSSARTGAEDAAHAALPEPVGAIAIDLSLEPTAASLVTPEAARACGMKDADGPLHRGGVKLTTGFVTPGSAAYGRFDSQGALQAVYVPGVFEARRTGAGVFEAAVSRAHNANTPNSPNLVSGCIGAASMTLCLYPGDEAQVVTLAPCLGDLAEFAIGDASSESAGLFARSAGRGEAVIYPAARLGPIGGGSLPPAPEAPLLIIGGGGSPKGDGGAPPPREGVPLPVPTPSPVALLAAALALLVAARASRAPRVGSRAAS